MIESMQGMLRLLYMEVIEKNAIWGVKNMLTGAIPYSQNYENHIPRKHAPDYRISALFALFSRNMVYVIGVLGDEN